MKTKLLQARHLHVGMEIVEGGDGQRRSARMINEVQVGHDSVTAVVRSGQGFEHKNYDPHKSVRVKLED